MWLFDWVIPLFFDIFNDRIQTLDWADRLVWPRAVKPRSPGSDLQFFFLFSSADKEAWFLLALVTQRPLATLPDLKKERWVCRKDFFFSQWILSLSCCAYPNHLGYPPSPHSSAPLPPSREPWDWWNMGLCGRSDFTKSWSRRRHKFSHRADLSHRHISRGTKKP